MRYIVINKVEAALKIIWGLIQTNITLLWIIQIKISQDFLIL